ncbi:VCBS repeat-containing protein [Aquimarina agarilytica]|uniref:VCBS repeat-containing protein n=1 Tax=Aquimarina agarilytica TaxID=1087449 RepID=UPI000289E33B|nr:VCBS repeat-containing protein [Aquimarina agarilytica]
MKSTYLLGIGALFLFGCMTDKKKEAVLLFSTLEAKETGIHFSNDITEDYNNFFGVYNYAYNGGGVAVGDINNDGLSDIYFTGNQVEDKLYLNKGGFVFEDITQKAGIKNKTSWHNGVVMADVNADGLLDIYICKGGWKDDEKQRANLLYINKGDGQFEEKAQEYHIADAGFSMMASFFDADNDNDLDLYVMNRPANFFIGFEQVLAGRENTFPNYRDKLYINNNNQFTEQSELNGITKNFGHGLGVVTSDLDNDGNIDIYVANDYNENDYLYKNKGKGVFEESIREHTNHVAYYGMGVDVFDVNNDGLEDIFELDMSPEDYYRSKVNMPSMQVDAYAKALKSGIHRQSMHNVLQLNSASGFFSEIGQLAGVAQTDWSWSCLGADLDNDGWRDVLVTNGYKRDIWNKDVKKEFDAYTSDPSTATKPKAQIISEIVNLYPSEKLSNYAFKNNGDLSFDRSAKKWGLATPSFSNGMATADLDNDGDLDIVINNIDDKAFVYKNNSETASNNFLRIKLKGPKKNPFGLGAKATIFYNNKKQYQEFKTVRGYLSSVEPIIHFGLGVAQKIDSLLVKWPDGKSQLVHQVGANRQLDIFYKEAIFRKSKKASKDQIFKELSSEHLGIDYKHAENDYDDYNKQILLPHKLSEEGPVIKVADVNGDGLDDFFAGGAMGQSGVLFIQNQKGIFEKKEQLAFDLDKHHEDVSATFFDVDGDNDRDLYIVSGGNEEEVRSEFYRDRLYINSGKGVFRKSEFEIPIRSSGSCVIPFDMDKDGDLDLLVGGRHVPGKYPSAPESYILENTNSRFVDVTDKIAPELKKLGMVTDAAVVDLNNDGENELILVGEWMPITVFANEEGVFKNKTSEFGFEHTQGWWNCIEVNDFDKDGDLDFFVGNLGLNYKFKASQEKPFGVVASDYDKNGTFDVFLTKKINNKTVPVRGKECATQQIPSLAQKIPTFADFAKADIQTILGDNKGEELQVNMFESVYVENKSEANKYEISRLPTEAQFSTVNDFLIADFNQDGYNEVLLAGNRFGVELETTPSDASQGLMLKAKATMKGEFDVLDSNSGFSVSDNVKSLEAITINKKGASVLIGINNRKMKFYSFEK